MAWSNKKKRGRPPKAVAWDYGSDRVQARAALFHHFGGDGGRGHEMTCAGRLMLVGAFDGLTATPEESLAALARYADGYWSYYSGGPKVGAYERQDRSHDTKWEDLRGEWFNAMDGRLRDAGHSVRLAVHSVSVDRHWFPDENPAWVDAIINRRFFDKGLPVAGEIATVNHEAWAMLELLRQGALALVGEPLRRAA